MTYKCRKCGKSSAFKNNIKFCQCRTYEDKNYVIDNNIYAFQQVLSGMTDQIYNDAIISDSGFSGGGGDFGGGGASGDF